MEVQEQQILADLAKAVSELSGGRNPVYDNLPYGMKAAGTPSSDAYLYVNGGLFGRCDGTSSLINAMVGPRGFEANLEWFGTNTEREFIDALAAIVEAGSEQTTSCGDCISISLRACAQFYCFGRFCRQTEELQFDRIGLMGNEAVPVKTLFGDITDSSGRVLVQNGETIRDAFFLQSRAAGYALSLKNHQLLWAGNPCNNSGAYQEFPGFDLIINTGKFDAYTQLDCDSIDSFLMDFNFANPTSDGANAITNWFRRMILQLSRRAEGAGMSWDSAEHFIVMRDNTWECVAKVYACAGIDLCSLGNTNSEINASADAARERYEEYLARRALPIMGRWYPVVLDSEITQSTGQANGVCSDIYFITTKINGESITFGQYQDFNQTYGQTRQELTSMFGSDDIAITDNGRFALVRDNTRGCFDVQVYTKPRIVARAPWLLGRIQNVCCDVLQSPLPDTTAGGGVYELAGGRTTTPIPTLYGDCVNC
jgi:hypothetical protein